MKKKEKEFQKMLAELEAEAPTMTATVEAPAPSEMKEEVRDQDEIDDINEAIAAFTATEKERQKVSDDIRQHPIKEICRKVDGDELKALATEILLRKCNQVPIGGKTSAHERIASHCLGMAATFLNQFTKYTSKQ